MRILLCAHYKNEYDLGRYCTKALKDLRHSVKVFDYLKNANIFGYHITPWLRKSAEIGINRANKMLKKQVEDWNPDLVLVLKGELIKNETIRYIKNKLDIKIINWFPDFPYDIGASQSQFSEIASSYDCFFVSFGDTIQELNDLSDCRIEFMPFACDPSVHRSINLTEGEKKELGCEISFVGAMYPNRVAILQNLTMYNLKIWGPRWKQVRNKVLKKMYIGDYAYSEIMVKIFNASKININVHKVDVETIEKSGVNMRLFEIAGSGGFQLTDYRLEIPDLFKIGKEVVCYTDENDLKELVNYYLNNPDERKKIASAAQNRAYKEHTYKHRMDRLLSIV